MKIVAKYRTSKGGWAFVRCPCCSEKRVFGSWLDVRRYFEESGVNQWKASRLR